VSLPFFVYHRPYLRPDIEANRIASQGYIAGAITKFAIKMPHLNLCPDMNAIIVGSIKIETIRKMKSQGVTCSMMFSPRSYKCEESSLQERPLE
jgi:hypothetical protein